MSLNYYSKEEDYDIEESINQYKDLFSSYKDISPTLSDSLKQMFKSENLDEIKCEELVKDILNKCEKKIAQNLDEIQKQYKNITKEDAYIICSYACESKENKYSPYLLLNKNLLSENRKNSIVNISKYLFILLKSLRKLPRYYPSKEKNCLYRHITQKVNLEKDNLNYKIIPYKINTAKTFRGFVSTSLEKEKEIKSGTIFSLEGDIWGYDIELFNYNNEKEILLEPERQFIIKNILSQNNDVINTICKMIKTPLILLDNETEQNNIIINEIEDNNNDKIDTDSIDVKQFENPKLENPDYSELIPQKGNDNILPNNTQKENSEQKKISFNFYDVRVIKYVDYSSKYGLGYVLSNGHVGTRFNDSTMIIYKPNGTNFIYIDKQTKNKIVKEYKLKDKFDKDLNKKVILLEHFENYLLKENKKPKVKKESENIDISNYVYVKRYKATEHAISFNLNNKICQTVFNDKTEIILNTHTYFLTYIDKRGTKKKYPLDTEFDSNDYQMKKRLKYVKRLLGNMIQEHVHRNDVEMKQ